jgi:hypothetical protein
MPAPASASSALYVAPLPPADLSFYGLNFTMEATWLVLTSSPLPKDTMTTAVSLALYQATHCFDSNGDPSLKIAAITLANPAATGSLDLSLYALDPLEATRRADSSTIGFVAAQFDCMATTKQPQFAIRSSGNSVLVRGTGFSVPTSNDQVIAADVTSGPASMEVYFKTIDGDSDCSLYLKHWLAPSSGPLLLTLTINGDRSTIDPNGDPGTSSTITLRVDAYQSGSGSDNITQVYLRRKSYTSDDYYDYLLPGLNTILISIAAATSGGASYAYQLRALAISS